MLLSHHHPCPSQMHPAHTLDARLPDLACLYVNIGHTYQSWWLPKYRCAGASQVMQRDEAVFFFFKIIFPGLIFEALALCSYLGSSKRLVASSTIHTVHRGLNPQDIFVNSSVQPSSSNKNRTTDWLWSPRSPVRYENTSDWE
ncbi:hypothetical protein LY78DRAFT_725601 [Colletotrichum sublineola]|nr:hypothetical protein LY78DRAFT_725601 [Colletotrichum sublineola]